VITISSAQHTVQKAKLRKQHTFATFLVAIFFISTVFGFSDVSVFCFLASAKYDENNFSSKPS
jgi:hypothetical protein